ncbi:MAG: winged helix-turn-helix transcriptional regulator [Methanobacterium sp.]|nr:MAG: winged helix-turn-helix transcriptional regulator [Methanobacterium sp.]
MKKMNDSKYEYNLAVLVLGINLIRGKWAIQILWYLNKVNQRFSELYEYFRYTYRSVFTKELHDLKSAGLIKRKIIGEAPVRVEYSLTDIGETYLQFRGHG